MSNFLIGGDPEFAAIEKDNGWWLDAIAGEIRLNGDSEKLLLNIPPGYKQLPLIDTDIFAPVGQRSDPSLPIGQDGHPDIGEFRVPPAENPDEFVENIRLMIADLHDMVSVYENRTGKDVVLVGGSAVLDDPLGGHLHALASQSKAVCDALVMCLNLVYIPVVLVGYGPGEKFRRHYIKPGSQDSHPYGQLGDARFGWMRTRHRPQWDTAAMDWRVLSSYISHPELTGAVSALHYMVIDAFHSKEVPDLPVNLLFDEKLEDAFNNADRSYLSRRLPNFMAYWRQFPLYDDVRIQKLLQPLMQALQVADIFWPWVDIRSTWGIIESKPALKAPRNEMTSAEKMLVADRPRAIPLSDFVISSSQWGNPTSFYLSDRYRTVRVSKSIKGILIYHRTDGRTGLETSNAELSEHVDDANLVVDLREISELSFDMAKAYAERDFIVVGVPTYFEQEAELHNALTSMGEIQWR